MSFQSRLNFSEMASKSRAERSSLSREAVVSLGGRKWNDFPDNDENQSTCSSVSGTPTSAISVMSTQHSRERVDERQLDNKRLLQAAIKHGIRRASFGRNSRNQIGRAGRKPIEEITWKYHFVGLVHVTDMHSKKTITAYIEDPQVHLMHGIQP